MSQVHMQSRPLGPEVMVSYSSRDRDRVLQIVQRLRAAGVAVWIDQGGIDGAQRWGEEIVNAIEACKTVLLMVSQSSAQSDNIAKEVALAWESGKHFLPVYLEDAKIPKSMQYQLAGIQHIRLFDGDPEAKFLAVLRSLMRLNVRLSPYACALVCADSGDREQAFQWLDRACEQRSGGLARLKTETRFASLRNDPRFEPLVKRAESLTLESEEDSAMIPVLTPRLVETRPAPAGPAPWWRKFFWPDIFDDKSARQAAAHGVWACVFVIAASFLASIVTTLPLLGTGWNSVLFVAIVFGPIGFAIQKMGRPAAIIGLVLCASGVLGNLGTLRISGAAVDSYNMYMRQIPAQYRSSYNYPDPYPAYYYAWFSMAISLACVAAFTNATRGTFGYRQMVSSGRARDKQDAVSREDWAAIKAGVSARLKSFRGASAPRPAPVMMQPAAQTPYAARVLAADPSPAVLVRPAIVETPVPTTTPPAAIQPAISAPAMGAPSVLARKGFAALIGAKPFDVRLVGAFLAANVAAALASLMWLAGTTQYSVPAAYWILAIAQACIFTAAACVGFRLLRNLWLASLVAAALSTVAALPFWNSLPTFVFADVVYREQFQQFILLPFVSSFILLAALVLLTPRLQPLPLALWAGAMCAEIVTTVTANLLRTLGAGEPPDALLASTSLLSAIVRSVVFAGVLWGVLSVVKEASRAKPSLEAS